MKEEKQREYPQTGLKLPKCYWTKKNGNISTLPDLHQANGQHEKVYISTKLITSC